MSGQSGDPSWPLFEVFIRARSGLEHKHVGSVHAVDAAMALEHARDLDESKIVVAILPDAGAKYVTKMYNDEWMRGKGFLD